MKKFLLAFLIFISVAETKISFGQAYHPFPDTLAQWFEGSRICQTNLPDIQCWDSGWVYCIAHDTIIDGYVYALLGVNGTYTGYEYGPMLFGTNYTYQFPGKIVGAIREDSTRKIWFRKLDSDFIPYCWAGVFGVPPLDSDIILYDFNVQAGDSLPWKPIAPQVLSIDSFQLDNGEWRRRINFFGDSWIEGIGSSLGLFGSHEYLPVFGGCYGGCFKQDSVMLLTPAGLSEYDCDHIVGVTAIGSQKSISVFPNPTSDFITFDLRNFSHEKFSIAIYNSNGQQVNHYSNLHSSQLKIPVNEIGGDGMYFYTVKMNDEKLFAGKFLIQR